MPAVFALGLDFGTASVRALITDTRNGEEIATATFDYPTGDAGVVTERSDPNLARQHPGDYLAGATATVRQALAIANAHPGFAVERIIGIGVDSTGSTPLPVDAQLTPLALKPEFDGKLAAQAWLWKDHSAHAEAAEITDLARQHRPEYLARCGGTYSSEWFWSKVLRCTREHPQIAAQAATWLELCDFVPAWLCGIRDANDVQRSICAAAHKAMYHPEWNGLPDEEFLGKLSPQLPALRSTFANPARASNHRAGTLCEEVAQQLGLPAGIPVAVGALDAHLGAVGSGVAHGTLVKILGTSTCDCMVAPLSLNLPEIPGLCGIAPESILPGMHGIEAGQSAVGDIFQWFVNKVAPRDFCNDNDDAAHAALSEAATQLQPGASGLLALDWHNGNRSVLTDPRLSGMVLGLSLQTTPPELYRAWIEATAFGARVILDRLEECGAPVQRVITCGGVAEKSPLLMQIYADVCQVPLLSARSTQACALGAAICGAVVGGAHDDLPSAQRHMTGTADRIYEPGAASSVYARLYALYRQLHDAFGQGSKTDLSQTMKQLMQIRDEQRHSVG